MSAPDEEPLGRSDPFCRPTGEPGPVELAARNRNHRADGVVQGDLKLTNLQ